MITKIMLSIAVVFGFVFTSQMAFSGTGHAQLFKNATSEACKGTQLSGATGTSAANCVPSEKDRINKLLKTIINLLSVIVGIAAVIVIIVNGLRYVVSGGDSNAVGAAKKGIIYAVVGLLIVALAQFIVKFVLTKVG